MSILLGHDLRIFATTNLDTNGFIKSTNFTASNTKEILISAGSFIFSQESVHDVVDLSLGIESTANNDGYAGAYMKTGSLAMRCILNSSKIDALPFDKIIWDSLTKSTEYPIGWNTTASTKQLVLNRTEKNIKPFGIIAIANNVVYLFDNCRAAEAAIQLDIKEICYVNWSISYTRQRRLDNISAIRSDTLYSFSGAIVGEAERTNISNYYVSASKLMRTTIFDRTANTTYNLASINSNVTITNAHLYIDNVNMGESTRLALFAGAGNFNVSCTVGFYTRSTGDSNTLVQHLVNNELDSTQKHEYKITIDIINMDGTTTLVQIILDGVRITLTEMAGQVLSATANIKMFSSPYNANSGIKFCS